MPGIGSVGTGARLAIKGTAAVAGAATAAKGVSAAGAVVKASHLSGVVMGGIKGADHVKDAEKVAQSAESVKKIFKSVDDILENANPGRVTKGKATQWNKTGGLDQALDDFNDLGVTDIKDIPGGKIGKLSDGRTVNVRTKSSDRRPTLEIFDGKKSTKIRYDK